MVKGRGIRRQAQRFRPNMRRRVAKTPKSDFCGISARAPSRPRSAQEAPWNSIVVQRRVAVADNSAFTANTVYITEVLLAQLELPTTVNVSWRLRSIDIYDLGGRPFDARIYDYNSGTGSSAFQGQLATGISVPARNGWSSMKLIFPKAIATQAHRTGTGASTWLTGNVGTPVGITSVTSGFLLLRFHLLWRPLTGTGAPVGFHEHAEAHGIPFAVAPSKAYKVDDPPQLAPEAVKRLRVSGSPMRA